jgi:hypothetical protein
MTKYARPPEQHRLYKNEQERKRYHNPRDPSCREYHRQYSKVYHKAYYQAHREMILQTKAQFYRDNTEMMKERNRRYHQAWRQRQMILNPDKLKEINRRYYQAYYQRKKLARLLGEIDQ